MARASRRTRGPASRSLWFLGFSRLGPLGFPIYFISRARRADLRDFQLSPQQLNSKRLKEYKASLILFPRRTAKPKAGDSDAGELAITKEDKPLEMVSVTEEMKGFNAYQKLRTERMNVRQVGPRIKKAEEAAKKAEEEAKTAKMK